MQLLVWAAVGVMAAAAAQPTGDTIAAEDGVITVTPIVHGSVQVEYDGMVIHVDPWGEGDYTTAKKADLVLVTDIHGDHLDPDALAAIRKQHAPIVAPAAVAKQLDAAVILDNGDRTVTAGISIEAVPMYNLTRGPEPGQLFHPKGRGNGYVITLGGRRVYFSGDTECVPEIRTLQDVDVAFVTMNLPYTMTPAEAAECVKAFDPSIVYPYHYRGSNLEGFTEALRDTSIEVRIRDRYAGMQADGR